MADLSEKCRIGGYISVRTVLEAGTREVYGLLLDKKRMAKVKESAFHLPENGSMRRWNASPPPAGFL